MSRPESLTDIARTDALRNVSRVRWATLGVILGIVPTVNIILFGIFIGIVSVLTPKIDLSTAKRLAFYFQNPACYTVEYRKTAKRLRSLWTLYGWLAGVIGLNFFF